MRNFVSVGLLGLLVMGNALYAQDAVLASYERNFLRASLGTKVNILTDAPSDELASEFIGELYEFALGFSLQNADLLRNDPDFINLTILASRGAGASGHTDSVNTLWSVFSSFLDAAIRVEALGALAVLATGNTSILENINQFAASQNSLFRSGVVPDLKTLSACISALRVLGDRSSVPVLYEVMRSGYDESITAEAAEALEALSSEHHQYLISVIQWKSPVEKLEAFTIAVNNEKFSDDERGDLVEIALEVALDGAGERDADLDTMRYEAVKVLRELEWSRAAALVIRHYYRVQQDYGEGKAPKEQVVEAIACMGAMASSEAAQVLALHLGYLNSLMEQNGAFDAPVTLGTVSALGDIGDKIAFDYLLYVSYLPYPERILNAAKGALGRLKW
ncbi:hypothetical protein AGMMS50267_02840 [Spirochaetia bacterium]|nr:hypothetical protein AGMMS50267_02840 [Spirochaetia bacterium]